MAKCRPRLPAFLLPAVLAIPFITACNTKPDANKKPYKRSLLYTLPTSSNAASPFFLRRGTSLTAGMVAHHAPYFAFINPEHNAVGVYNGKKTVMHSNFEGMTLRYLSLSRHGLFGLGVEAEGSPSASIRCFELPHKKGGSPYVYDPIPVQSLGESPSPAWPRLQSLALSNQKTLLLWKRNFLVEFQTGNPKPLIVPFSEPELAKEEVFKAVSLTQTPTQALFAYALYSGKLYRGTRIKRYDYAAKKVVSASTLTNRQEHFFGFHNHQDALTTTFQKETRTIDFKRYLFPDFEAAEERKLVLRDYYPIDFSASGKGLSGYVLSDEGLLFYTWQ